ncbi:MAG: hypothetical protein WA908_01570 [Pontixanthobacter sp.]
MPSKPRKGVQERVADALVALTTGAAEVLHHTKTAWSSATFSGERHTVRLEFSGHDALAASAMFEAELPGHEFDIVGHLVCDAGVAIGEHDYIGEAVSVILTAQLLLLKDE